MAREGIRAGACSGADGDCDRERKDASQAGAGWAEIHVLGSPCLVASVQSARFP
jgi:hypothetical protein